MPGFIRDSLRAKFIIGVSVMLLPLLGLGAGAFLGINSINGSFNEVVEEVIEEIAPIMALQIAILHAAEPANDYLITGKRSEGDEFARLSEKVERAFRRIEGGPSSLTENRASVDELLGSAHEAWRQARSMSERLLALPQPVGDAAAAHEMKRMDTQFRHAADLLGRVHEVADREIKREFANATATGNMMLQFVFGVFGLGFAVAISVGAALAWSILSRVKVLSEGTRAFGEGDFSYRVQVKGYDELGQLAQSFNAMAEALEKSRATIEQRASQLDAINQTAVAINSSLQLKDILDEIMRRGITLTGGTASGIAFYDEAAGRFTNWVTQGLSENFVRNMNFRPGGLADEAFTSGSHVLSNDRPETAHKLSRLAREEHLRCFICLPLTSRDRRLGVIYVYRADRDTFTPTEVELLTTFSSLAAQVIENARLHAQVQEQARTDALTGLSNRGEFQRQLKQEEERSRRYNRSFSLLMLDIDHFKTVNDSYGHQAGDELLRALAARLGEQTRPVDHVARYGGEEFVVILPETGRDGALVSAGRLRTAVADTAVPVTEGRTIPVTISIGVATFPVDGESETALIAAADAALYAAKQGGRNRVIGYEPALGHPAAQG
ncbi:MAG: diguanylate cyclase [Burkholderiales bacterium]|nr:diguanylate cyclase [Burkholderiales bacterium]